MRLSITDKAYVKHFYHVARTQMRMNKRRKIPNLLTSSPSLLKSLLSQVVNKHLLSRKVYGKCSE